MNFLMPLNSLLMKGMKFLINNKIFLFNKLKKLMALKLFKNYVIIKKKK